MGDEDARTGRHPAAAVGPLGRYVAERLKDLRARRGIARARFAGSIGVSVRTLNRIDSHQRAIRVEELWKALALLEAGCQEVLPKPTLPVPDRMDAEYVRLTLQKAASGLPFDAAQVVKAVAQAAGASPAKIEVRASGNSQPYPMLRAACGIIAEQTPWLEVQEMAYALGYSQAAGLHQRIRRYRRMPKSHPVWKLASQAQALLKDSMRQRPPPEGEWLGLKREGCGIPADDGAALSRRSPVTLPFLRQVGGRKAVVAG